jgi:hypothetical protein
MRIVLIAPSSQEALRWSSALPRAAGVCTVTNWRIFLELAAASDCSIIVADAKELQRAGRWLRILRRRRRRLPVLIITDDAKAVQITDSCASVVTSSEGQVPWLWGAVQSVCSRGFLASTADQLLQGATPGQPLRRAIAELCVDPTPPRSIQEMAARAGVSRRTLWLHWRNAPWRPKQGLHDVIRQLLLLRACVYRGEGATWSTAARSVGATRPTLDRTARETVHVSLRRLDPQGHNELRQSIAEGVAMQWAS